MKTITYAQIMEAHRQDPDLKGKPYGFSALSYSEDAALLRKILSVGIDPHLEACLVSERGDKVYTEQTAVGPRLHYEASVESLPVFLRRLWELGEQGDENAWRLCGDFLDHLDIDNEEGCFKIISPIDEKGDEDGSEKKDA